ncbi:MAG: SPOR domain-containing protein [Candidatus Syntrophosphaera sp.]|nr:SPOR domain-containing protein [Candidatus Syntrophosphaera sp.]
MAFRPEFQNLANLYQSGRLDELASQLLSSKASNDEERALQSYLSAMLKTRKSESMPLLQQTADRYPNTHYGQLAMLERARIHILEREIAEAKALLQRIRSTEIRERFYWLGVCADALDDHASTISHCDQYLRLDPAGTYIGEAHYLLAGAYQEQGKYQSGITTLRKLEALPGHPRDEQYFYYRLGRLYQLAGNNREAMLQYKKGFELNRNSQVAFLIEDSLFELKERHGSAIDISFLYPYTAMDIIVPAEDAPPITTPDLTTELKLDAKPSGGFFVQAGRFSVETRASQLSLDIRAINLGASYFEDKANRSTPWVVVSGPYPSRTEADAVRQALIGKGIECFITQF